MIIDAWRIRPHRPWVPVQRIRGTIKKCKATTWLLVGEARFRIGSTAFLTEVAAERRRQGLLDRLRKTKVLERLAPGAYAAGVELATVHVYREKKREAKKTHLIK
jgi:hypothetical protein